MPCFTSLQLATAAPPSMLPRLQNSIYQLPCLQNRPCCRFALPEDRTEIDELAAQHQQLGTMADLWTAYATVQAFALGAMLLLYARYWLFQASAGAIPRAVLVFASDGASITVLVVAFCGLSAVLLHVLVGPALPETANVGSAALSLGETFLSGSSDLEGRLLNVRLVST